jgi:hypothetical protein
MQDILLFLPKTGCVAPGSKSNAQSTNLPLNSVQRSDGVFLLETGWLFEGL